MPSAHTSNSDTNFSIRLESAVLENSCNYGFSKNIISFIGNYIKNKICKMGTTGMNEIILNQLFRKLVISALLNVMTKMNSDITLRV